MPSLNEQIRAFYDQSSPLWLAMWGEHMHHGYYGPDGKTRKDHRQAQLDLIDQMLDWGGVSAAQRVLDAGCGVGGSARYLARRFGASVLGLTLSPVQAQRGAAYNREAGLTNQVEIRVQDVYELLEPPGSFDLIYSMESAEHMADKQGLLELFYRMLAPGGRLVMATWCCRDTTARPLTGAEKRQLAKIYDVYHLPPMISLPQYENLARTSGFQAVATADWSPAVAPFWGAVIRSAFTWRGLSGLLKAGPSTIKGAWAMRYMQAGYRSGLIRFGLLQGVK